ncbi:MAG: hypothetical protein FWG90_00020 [Oscillospiraceae bacterium]|nr:hypothetical protein [Oscillospiraceae bacterium]
MALSENLNTLIQSIISTQEFWKINYYLRSMKKAPHGGVFYTAYPNTFLKYYTASAYLFFSPNAKIPAPILDTADKFREMIDIANIDTEELLQYCLGIDGNPNNGNRMYIASYGKIITSIGRNEIEHMTAVSDAIEGRISYLGNFDINGQRLSLLFIFTLIESFAYRIHDVNEIINNEKLIVPIDKYGLSDVTGAKFERQGFRLDDKYYLYNIFLDTSIGSPIANVPKTIEIIRNIKLPVQIFMRCDENLAIPYLRMVSNAGVVFQKWRGVTLNFDNITEQMKSGKETIVHFDSQSMHKILVYVKRGADETGMEFYHMNVEQLWNPNIFTNDEDVIITNYIHGTYYPLCKTFEHIDFSVNQYNREVFEAKYRDAEKLTGVSIVTYGNLHYKIWCIRGDNLISAVWADLVCASLDAPFRNIFMETIGGTYIENDG